MAYIHVETKPKIYAKVYCVYNGGIGGNTNIDIKRNYPNVDYTQLTNEDFICTYKSDSSHTGTDQSTGTSDTRTWYEQANAFSLNPSYNPSNGILTLVLSTTSSSNWNCPAGSGSSGWSNLKVAAYMIVDGVREDYVK